MADILVALVQCNPTVGALSANADLIAARAQEAAAQGASVVVFPELVLSGYPPEDLVLKKHFLHGCERQLARLAGSLPRDIVTVVGCPRLAEAGTANAAAVFSGGEMVGTYRKMMLPNYGVFDEKRVFAAGDKPLVLHVGAAAIGIHICEDSWSVNTPAFASLRDVRLDGLVNLSASPYHRGKLGQREQTLGRAAAWLNAHVLYCNLVGGQDELVFDGASMVIAPDGRLVARAQQFEPDILLFELPVRSTGQPTPPVPSPSTSLRAGREGAPSRSSPPLEGWSRASGTGVGQPEVIQFPMIGKEPAKFSKDWKTSVTPALDDLAEVYAALKLGLRDYVDKNGFQRAVVALSGGIDSALVAVIAADALGKERVAGVTMPSRYSSDGTRADAAQLAANLGIEFLNVPINDLVEAYGRGLAPLWPGRPPDVTEENLQARIRGNIVMALSNKFGWLVLATGNKSELATGYCTLYGDMVGGFAVLKDVPKTLVFELARWRNAHGGGPVIPPSTIDRPPTAELRPNQKDTDSLPPYDVLDPIIERYVERDMGVDEIVADGFDPETVGRVARLVDRSEYKRRQGAPGIKITPKAFGRDRRMPITNAHLEQP